MRTRSIPIEAIHVPDIRVTAVYDEELLAQLRGSLEVVGQLQPIVVVQTGETYELVDGLHRLQEAQHRGETRIPAVVYEGEAADVLLLNLVTNNLRGKIAPSQMVEVIGALVHIHGMDSEAIAKRTGYTRDYVERLWAISEASPGVKAALDEGKIGIGIAYELSRIKVPSVADALCAEMVAFRTTTKDAKVLIDEVLRLAKEPLPAPPPLLATAPPPPRCGICEQVEEPKHLAVVMMCRSCYGATYDVARARAKVVKELAERERSGPGEPGAPRVVGVVIPVGTEQPLPPP